MTNQEIIKRFHALQADRKVAEESWDLIERFIYPIGGGKFFQPLSVEGEMDWRRRDVYDDTAINGADGLAASLHGSLTSPAIRWFDLKFDTPELQKDLESQVWLESCAKICWSNIQKSNFNMEVAEGYLDLVSFGNTTITQEPNGNGLTWNGIGFESIPLRETYFEETETGQVRASYRHLQWKPSQFISKFGDNVPDIIKARYESADQNKISVIFCIYPNPDAQDSTGATITTVQRRPYLKKYILLEGAEQVGETDGCYEMPVYAVRWRRAPGSQWGYGPGHLALPTVLTINELVKMVLEAAEKVIDPPSLVRRRAAVTDLDLSPGGHVIVDDINNSLKPYESASRFDVSALQVSDLRDMIRRLFHVDQLELKESPAMSATEVMVRYELMNRLLGPTMGRLQSDLLNPLVTNTFKMLFRAKQFPEPPRLVREMEGEMRIEYTGPLSRAQKSDEVTSVERWLTNIANFAQIFPELRHVPNPVEIGKFLADGLNVPAKLMNSSTKITTEINKDKAAQNQAMANEQRAQAAEVTKLETGTG